MLLMSDTLLVDSSSIEPSRLAEAIGIALREEFPEASEKVIWYMACMAITYSKDTNEDTGYRYDAQMKNMRRDGRTTEQADRVVILARTLANLMPNEDWVDRRIASDVWTYTYGHYREHPDY